MYVCVFVRVRVRVCVSFGTVRTVPNPSRYITLVSCCSDTHFTQVMRCLLGLSLVTTFIFAPTLGTLHRQCAWVVTVTLPRYLYVVPVAS